MNGFQDYDFNKKDCKGDFQVTNIIIKAICVVIEGFLETEKADWLSYKGVWEKVVVNIKRINNVNIKIVCKDVWRAENNNISMTKVRDEVEGCKGDLKRKGNDIKAPKIGNVLN